MAEMTITEALQSLKTIDGRIGKKRELMTANLVRQEQFKDPLAKDGGSALVIGRERQAVQDLLERRLVLRRAIQVANENTSVTVGGVTRTIADWLVWKREVASVHRDLLAALWNGIQAVRADAARKSLQVVNTADLATKPTDIIVNLDESALAKERESLEEIYNTLDGLLSLKNATTMVKLPD